MEKMQYIVVMKYIYKDLELYISANYSFVAKNHINAINREEKFKLSKKIKDIVGNVTYVKSSNECRTKIVKDNELNITRINIRECIYPCIEYLVTDDDEIGFLLEYMTQEKELVFTYESSEVVEMKSNFELYCNNRVSEDSGYMIDISDACRVVPVIVQKIDKINQLLYICSCNEEKSTSYIYGEESIGTVFFETKEEAEMKQNKINRKRRAYGTY